MFDGIKKWFGQLSEPVQKEKAVLQKFSAKYQDCDKVRLHLIFYGKVQGVKSLISYEGKDAKELIYDFHQAVDDYLRVCAT